MPATTFTAFLVLVAVFLLHTIAALENVTSGDGEGSSIDSTSWSVQPHRAVIYAYDEATVTLDVIPPPPPPPSPLPPSSKKNDASKDQKSQEEGPSSSSSSFIVNVTLPLNLRYLSDSLVFSAETIDHQSSRDDTGGNSSSSEATSTSFPLGILNGAEGEEEQGNLTTAATYCYVSQQEEFNNDETQLPKNHSRIMAEIDRLSERKKDLESAEILEAEVYDIKRARFKRELAAAGALTDTFFERRDLTDAEEEEEETKNKERQRRATQQRHKRELPPIWRRHEDDEEAPPFAEGLGASELSAASITSTQRQIRAFEKAEAALVEYTNAKRARKKELEAIQSQLVALVRQSAATSILRRFVTLHVSCISPKNASSSSSSTSAAAQSENSTSSSSLFPFRLSATFTCSATWRPEYMLHVESKKRKSSRGDTNNNATTTKAAETPSSSSAKTTLLAQVSQDSGIEWKDVEIELSSATEKEKKNGTKSQHQQHLKPVTLESPKQRQEATNRHAEVLRSLHATLKAKRERVKIARERAKMYGEIKELQAAIERAVEEERNAFKELMERLKREQREREEVRVETQRLKRKLATREEEEATLSEGVNIGIIPECSSITAAPTPSWTVEDTTTGGYYYYYGAQHQQYNMDAGGMPDLEIKAVTDEDEEREEFADEVGGSNAPDLSQSQRASDSRRVGALESFELTGLHTVPSSTSTDTTTRRLLVGRTVLPCTITREAVPLLDPRVFLTAEVVNPSPVTLFAGPATLYVDGQSKGNIAFPDLASNGGRAALSLGKDERMSVRRRVVTSPSSLSLASLLKSFDDADDEEPDSSTTTKRKKTKNKKRNGKAKSFLSRWLTNDGSSSARRRGEEGGKDGNTDEGEEEEEHLPSSFPNTAEPDVVLITLENRRSMPVAVVLRDRVPYCPDEQNALTRWKWWLKDEKEDDDEKQQSSSSSPVLESPSSTSSTSAATKSPSLIIRQGKKKKNHLKHQDGGDDAGVLSWKLLVPGMPTTKTTTPSSPSDTARTNNNDNGDRDDGTSTSSSASASSLSSNTVSMFIASRLEWQGNKERPPVPS